MTSVTTPRVSGGFQAVARWLARAVAPAEYGGGLLTLDQVVTEFQSAQHGVFMYAA